MFLLIMLYPLYATYLAIKKPLKNELYHWITFWFVYESIMFINNLVWWLPFIETIEYFLIISLYFPPLTDQMRRNLIFPHVKKLDRYLKKVNFMTYFRIVSKYTRYWYSIVEKEISGFSSKRK